MDDFSKGAIDPKHMQRATEAALSHFTHDERDTHRLVQNAIDAAIAAEYRRQGGQ